MRKFLLMVLLAGSAAPAIALAPDGDREERRGERKSERSQARSERPAPRAERGERQTERQEVRREAREARESAAPPEPRGVEPGAPARTMERRSERQEARDSVREWRSEQRQRADSPAVVQERNLGEVGTTARRGGQLVQQERPLPPVLETKRERRISRTPAYGAEPPPPPTATTQRAKPSRQWSSNWRRDRRYDWRDWRRRHGSSFRIGFYYDPFGWDYFRYGIGWRMWPSYYGSRHWIRDPWMYRLPPAYGPYRWVRYWNDAMLVNIYTGQVVDVVYNFFW